MPWCIATLHVRASLCTVVDEDPEYEFADNFRASRKSNQSRQMLLHQLSCRLRRQIGIKVRWCVLSHCAWLAKAGCYPS